jgi:hypothetical protein
MVHTPPETSSEEMGIRGRELVTALCLSKISFAISYEGVRPYFGSNIAIDENPIVPAHLDTVKFSKLSRPLHKLLFRSRLWNIECIPN